MTTHTRTIQREFITEHLVPGLRVGRHIEHDPKSRDYPYLMGAAGVATLQSLRRKRRLGPFNQGNTGACTGEAGVGATASAPFKNPLKARAASQKVPLKVYSLATTLDGFSGTFPPTDTGSTGLAAAKALKQLGAISSYRHAFRLADALAASADPTVGVIYGVNWYDSFDRPDGNGVIDISPNAQVRGGHEIENDGVVLAVEGNYSGDDLVWFWQSWGLWGLKGQFAMRVRTLDRLLSEQGDVTVLIK